MALRSRVELYRAALRDWRLNRFSAVVLFCCELLEAEARYGLPVVLVDSWGVVLFLLGGVVVGSGVGPFFECCVDEALLDTNTPGQPGPRLRWLRRCVFRLPPRPNGAAAHILVGGS